MRSNLALQKKFSVQTSSSAWQSRKLRPDPMFQVYFCLVCIVFEKKNQGIRTTATLDESGKYYIVSGEKKFITGAAYADYFTTAVKTENGVSVLLVEKGPGVSVRRLKVKIPSWCFALFLFKFVFF